MVINQFLSRLRFEHRYRMRFRDGTHPYRNRIRYRLNAFAPLNGTTIAPGTVFLSVFDEIFLNPRGPAFERNRVYAGVGYQVDAQWTVQAGWVGQTNYHSARFGQGVFTPQSAAGKNNVVLTLSDRISRNQSATPRENLLSQQD